MGPIIGIDLGTTNSVAAFMKDGQPVIIPNMEGEALTPSVVAFAHDDRRWVGRIARAQAVANPLRTFFSVKRRMGTSQDQAQDQWSGAEYAGAGKNDTVVASIKRQMGSDYVVTIDGRNYTPVDISAMILEKIKADAEAYLGEPVTRAVVTVPAYFNDSQRRSTHDAAAIAGLEVVRLVNEPTAAALAYGLDMERAHTILVWDLGGGTFDVSVLELGDGVFQVKAVSGDTHLGGDDYDQRLVDILTDEFRRLWQVDLTATPACLRLARKLAEEAKIRLSTDIETTVVLPRSFAGGNRCEVAITRDAFEQATRDLMDKMAVAAQNALIDARLDACDLDRVVLVGGMTRMPAVRRLVREITGIEPYGHVDPDKVVALGAAIQAGVLAGQVRKVTLVDVTPLSLGIETQGGLFARVIPRNTSVPTRDSKLFTNARDAQTAMRVRVLQGERDLAADNMPLGEFELSGITAQPRGEAKVEVVFDIDANGIIHVSATDLQTDASSRIRVSAAARPSAQDVQRMLAEGRARMESDRRKREEIVSAIKAENIIRASRAMLEEACGLANCEPVVLAARAVEDGAEAVEMALSGGEPELIASAGDAMEPLLKRLSDAIRVAHKPRGEFAAESMELAGQKAG